MSAPAGVLLHTAMVSHHRDARGGLRSAWAMCTDCAWVGPTRLTAMSAFADARDHEDGVQVTA